MMCGMNKDIRASAEPRHPIKVVARRTGLTPDVLRVWEKRYGAVSPTRVDTGRRLYSDADVQRLLLLRRATLGGRRIGQVAGLPTDELEMLVTTDEAAMAAAPRPAGAKPAAGRTNHHLEASLDAVLRLDAPALENVVSGAAVALSTPALLDEVLIPLLHIIGEQWRVGTARVANEHLATAVTRSLLGRLRVTTEAVNGAPEVIVTTPAGQLHELGAMMAAMTAASEGWRVTYLGPNLPAEEIAAAAAQRNARAVALSVVYPADDPRVAEELRRLRELVGPEITILVGGSGAEHYAHILDDAGIRRRSDFATFRQDLESIRYRT
jgi:methanogenic corrinoid protein MtbC1